MGNGSVTIPTAAVACAKYVEGDIFHEHIPSMYRNLK